MSFFHTIYSISIDQFALALENPNLVKRIPVWIPKKLVNKRMSELIKAYSDISNKEQNKRILLSKIDIVSFEYKLNALETIYLVLKDYWLTCEIPKEVATLFKEYMLHELDLSNYINELEQVKKRILKMRDTLKDLVENMKEHESDEGLDFKKLVFNTDTICELKGRLGSLKLYKLPDYVNRADKLLKSRQHG